MYEIIYFASYIRSENGYATRVRLMYSIANEILGQNIKVIPICYITPRETLRWVRAKISKRNNNNDLFGISNSILMPLPSTNIFIRYLIDHILKIVLKKHRSIKIVWAETIIPGMIGYNLSCIASSKLIVDIHGAEAEELSEFGGSSHYKKKIKRLKSIEAIIVKNADMIVTISENMIKILNENYKTVPKAFTIIPCVPNIKKLYPEKTKNDRINKRNKLGLSSTIPLLLYTGSLSAWQCVKETVELFEKINKHIECSLLLLTTEINVAQTLISTIIKDESIKKKVLCMTVSHENIREYIALADIGFLLRKNRITNIVSSPTKFAEYLACGVPVISTNYAGNCGSIIKQYNCGYLVDLENTNVEQICNYISNVMLNRENIIDQCRIAATKEFNIELIIEKTKNKIYSIIK